MEEPYAKIRSYGSVGERGGSEPFYLENFSLRYLICTAF